MIDIKRLIIPIICLLLAIGAAILVLFRGSTSSTSSTPTASKTYPISELGVSIKIPEELAHLSHFVQQSTTTGPVAFMLDKDYSTNCIFGAFYTIPKNRLNPPHTQ